MSDIVHPRDQPSAGIALDRNERVLAAYRSGLTQAEVGAMFGITGQRVCQLMKRHGLDARPWPGGTFPAMAVARSAAVRHQRAIERPLLKRAAELAKEGLSFTQVAERLGVTKGFVAGAVYRHRRWADGEGTVPSSTTG